ncbi:hypothetical protein BU24DRAFT_234307 [Aaosphaeria arxii CBS 175.79]|uniref:DUF3712 domain-containing protein n=1 Tax=Aaosphaeria arxii CBS 175.79 TaxID=1450172 RepID=A0A6A5XKE6_9PLEO|nr:uncharacterized protein BU24DRAFT_234307 [Aaosphaeria arxii CBS 175.79]KAF2013287.1 hypothetical protein BU24DRAFT_234307 [Aaosphaeria arxii CBS 175.79]
MEDKNSQRTEEVAHNGYANEAVPRKKGGIINTLYPPGPKPGAGGRVKNHCRKFWWCDLLVIGVIVVVVVVPIIYVGIPKKAQHDLNASTLEVTSQDVSSPTPNGIHLKLVSLAKSGSSFHPTIEAFEGRLSLDEEGKNPFIVLPVPETKAEAETEIVVDQQLGFADKNNFVEYNKAVMGSESFDVYMNGKTKIRQSGLQPISVDYHKKITMKGLNKLQGLSISDVEILRQDAVLEDGSNMVGNVHIPNPSVLTIDLGDVTMNLSIDDQDIGTSLLPALVLKPGNNSYPMQSKIQQLRVISAIRSKYKNGIVPIAIKGNSSVANGEHLDYFEAAIQGNTVNVELDVGPALAKIGLNITSSA